MPDTPTHIELFGTLVVDITTGTTGQILFAGAAGFNADAESRRVPPPLAGVVKRIMLRTVEITAGAITAGAQDYFVEVYATRVAIVGEPQAASRAAFQLGRSLAPLIPVAASLARTDPDLSQYVEWPYILENPLAIGAGDPGAVPANLPGLLVVVNHTAIPDGVRATLGVGLLVESRQPGYPTGPQLQLGGTFATAPGGRWPLIT